MQFKLNQVTVGVLILLILLQIVSTVLTLPANIGAIGYNILDCVVCLQYVGLTYFFFDMSKNGRDCQIFVDTLGNIIVIKLDPDYVSQYSSSQNNSVSDDSQVKPYLRYSVVSSEEAPNFRKSGGTVLATSIGSADLNDLEIQSCQI